MKSWVVDSSMALSWALPDERSDRADGFWVEMFADPDLHIPALWWYEVVNALVVARRRERLDQSTATQVVSLLGRLPLKVDLPTAGVFLEGIRAVAHEHNLSAYDAAYLELALRTGSGLATLDSRLAAASRSAGIETWS